MPLPIVAIIGRPNVGKSSLLNALAGEMISIVEPTAGVTRDRISTIIERNDRYFELIDTGGYGLVDSEHLREHIEGQINRALESADLVVFMTDVREGVTPLDAEIARMLRKSSVEVIGVANKADTSKFFAGIGEFYNLGLGEFLCISATNDINKNLLLDKVYERISGLEAIKPAKPIMKIALVGKRNAGKSTLLNSIVGNERVIVSEEPGTTRDAIDVRFERKGETFTVIDTAGVRKKSKIKDDIEFYSYVRAKRSIRRADVVLFLIDSTVPVSQADKKLANIITDEYKSCILVVNKWDLAEDTNVTAEYEEYLTKVLPGLSYTPIAFTTATKSEKVEGVLDLAVELYKQSTTEIPTAKLNKVFATIKEKSKTLPSRGPVRGKIYYATQVSGNPIAILMFVNNPKLFEQTHRRFIINRLRELLGIDEVPIRLLARSHRKK